MQVKKGRIHGRKKEGVLRGRASEWGGLRLGGGGMTFNITKGKKRRKSKRILFLKKKCEGFQGEGRDLEGGPSATVASLLERERKSAKSYSCETVGKGGGIVRKKRRLEKKEEESLHREESQKRGGEGDGPEKSGPSKPSWGGTPKKKSKRGYAEMSRQNEKKRG